MATKNKANATGKELENVEAILSRSEQFIEKNQKNLIYGVLAVTLIVLGFLGFRHLYQEPKERKAEVAMFLGETYFARDSFALALNGNGADYIGFEGIIDDFGGTKAANLSKAYAGICYFKMGEYEKAIARLKSFSAKDKMIAPAITGLIGDCYVNMNNVKEGINYFKTAASAADNDVISPEYLKKAGRAYESLGQYKEAVEVYMTIKNKYAASTEASDIDKFIERASALLK